MNSTRTPFPKCIFILVPLLLIVILATNSLENSSHGAPLRLGLVCGPSSFCAFGLPQGRNSQFEIAIEGSADEILSALEGGHLDAALLPSDCLGKFDENMFDIAAVTSYLNLTIMDGKGAAAAAHDLDGRSLMLADAVRGSREMQMLRALLSRTDISVNLEFASEEALWRRAQAGDFDLMAMPAAQNSIHLRAKASHRTYNLTSKWREFIGSFPPAGSFVVVKRAVFEEKRAEIDRLLATIRDSVDYINAKRKKASMFIAAQFGGDPADVYFEIVNGKFVYLDGSAMLDSIAQLRGIGDYDDSRMRP